MGLLPLVKAFAIVVVGGLGSIPGQYPRRAAARLFRDHRRVPGLDRVVADRLGRRRAYRRWCSARPASSASVRRFEPAQCASPARVDWLARCLRAWSVLAAVPLVFGSGYIIGVHDGRALLRHLGGELGLHVRPDRTREFRPLAVHWRRRLHGRVPQREFRRQSVVEPARRAIRRGAVQPCVIGFPTLRLRGPYFALAMLSGAAVMQNLTIIFSDYTGGQDGLNGLEPILDSTLAYYYLTLAFLAGDTPSSSSSSPARLGARSCARSAATRRAARRPASTSRSTRSLR